MDARRRMTMLVAFGVSISLAAGQNTNNATDTTGGAQTDQGRRLEELKKEQALLAQQMATLQAEKNLLKEMFPASQTRHTAGLAITGDLIEGTFSAYEGLNIVAKEMAEQMVKKDPDGTTIVISSAEINNRLIAYKAFETQLAALFTEYENLTDQQKVASSLERFGPGAIAPALPGLISGALGSIGDIISFFRTDVKISAKAVTIPDDALMAALQRNLPDMVSVFHPAVYTPHTFGLGQDGIWEKLTGLRTKVGEAERTVAAYEMKTDAHVSIFECKIAAGSSSRA